MLSQVTDLVTTDAANTYWLPPTTYLLSTGEYRTGATATRSRPTGATGWCENPREVARRELPLEHTCRQNAPRSWPLAPWPSACRLCHFRDGP
jgi:hypothetical protein